MARWAARVRSGETRDTSACDRSANRSSIATRKILEARYNAQFRGSCRLLHISILKENMLILWLVKILVGRYFMENVLGPSGNMMDASGYVMDP